MRWHRALIRSFGLSISLLISVCSCDSTEEPVPENDAAYFPLKVGAYQIYDVEETQIDQIHTVKLAYQLHTEVSDSFPNQNGGYVYIITRTKRNNPASSWSPVDTWSARVDDKQVVVNEENIPYVKLSFPFAENKDWNGNMLNNLGGNEDCGTTKESCDIYTLENISDRYEINSNLSFDKTVTVAQSDEIDVILGKDVRNEVYALEVGLIYKESTILEYCSTGACAGKQEIIKGFIYKQVINEYGGY